MGTVARKERRKKIVFSLSAPYAREVSIAGDFNDWSPTAHPMKKDKKGVWKASLNLPPGKHPYRFLVDGEWQNDPGCADWVANPFGTLHCIRRVG